MSTKRKKSNNFAATMPSQKKAAGESSKAAEDKVLKLLVAAVKECCPPAKSMTAQKLCDLCDKYKGFDHRLPLLALAATCKEAIFNETLSTFSSDLTIGRAVVTKTSCSGERGLPDDAVLHEISATNPNLSPATITRLINSLDILIDKENKACFNDPKRDSIGGQCISIAAVGQLGKTLVQVLAQKRPRKDTILGAAMPLIEAIRIHPGIDGRPHVYDAADKSAGNDAMAALGKVCDRFPFIQRYLDPPHVMAIQTITAPPNLAQHFPPGRLVANPADAVDGNAPVGLISLAGSEGDAVWAADLLRSHYRDVAGNGGGPAPLPLAAPANVRIMSFSTTGAGIIQYH